MSEEHKMTKQDKLALGITLAAIFGGVFLLGKRGLGHRATERPLKIGRPFVYIAGENEVKK